MVLSITFQAKDEGLRAIDALRKHYAFSNRRIKKVKFQGYFKLNGVEAYLVVPVKAGDIALICDDKSLTNEISLKESAKPYIVHVANWFVAANKKANMLTHPNFWQKETALTKIISEQELHLVNRLDKDSSGLVLLATSAHAHSVLTQIELEKYYLTIVHGDMPEMNFGEEFVPNYELKKLQAHLAKGLLPNLGCNNCTNAANDICISVDKACAANGSACAANEIACAANGSACAADEIACAEACNTSASNGTAVGGAYSSTSNSSSTASSCNSNNSNGVGPSTLHSTRVNYCAFPICRREASILERRISLEQGKSSITLFRKLAYNQEHNISLLLCKLLTGRTHQIRLHCMSMGHPLVGESLYDLANLAEMAKLGFTERALSFKAEIPAYERLRLDNLRFSDNPLKTADYKAYLVNLLKLDEARLMNSTLENCLQTITTSAAFKNINRLNLELPRQALHAWGLTFLNPVNYPNNQSDDYYSLFAHLQPDMATFSKKYFPQAYYLIEDFQAKNIHYPKV